MKINNINFFIALFISLSTSILSAQLLQVSGKKIINSSNGEEVILNAMNTGNSMHGDLMRLEFPYIMNTSLVKTLLMYGTNRVLRFYPIISLGVAPQVCMLLSICMLPQEDKVTMP